MHAVEVENLVVRYGNLTAVGGVSFEADAGEVVALLGPNGAGKTTTVETLEGFHRPDEGVVKVLGLDPWSDHARLTTLAGVMLQRGGVYPVMSAAARCGSSPPTTQIRVTPTSCSTSWACAQ